MAATGKLAPDDFVRRSENGKWIVANKVKGLEFKKVAPEPTGSSQELQIPEPAQEICPACQSAMSDKAVLCVMCGYDLRVGKKTTGAGVEPKTQEAVAELREVLEHFR